MYLVKRCPIQTNAPNILQSPLLERFAAYNRQFFQNVSYGPNTNVVFVKEWYSHSNKYTISKAVTLEMEAGNKMSSARLLIVLTSYDDDTTPIIKEEKTADLKDRIKDLKNGRIRRNIVNTVIWRDRLDIFSNLFLPIFCFILLLLTFAKYLYL